MNELKHTPGPWSVARSGWDEHTCDVWYSLEGVKTSCIADANLIAAAPDMLHALNLALEYWQDRQQRYKNRSPVWVQEARAAIAKALGKQS